MKKLCLSISVVVGLLGGVQADQFNVMGRDYIRPNATGGAPLIFGADEIIAFSSYATSSLAQTYPEKYPRNPTILASTGQADSLYVYSTSNLDTQNMTVDGLDENWDRQIKVVAMNGRNNTRIGSSSTYWRRVNSVTLDVPARGTVRVFPGRNTNYFDSTKTVSFIKVGQAKAQIAMFTTWKDFQGSIQSWSMDMLKRGAGATPDTSWGVAGIIARTQSDSSWKVLYQRGISQGENIDVQFVQPIPLLPKMDMYVAIGVTAAPTEVVTNLGIGGQ